MIKIFSVLFSILLFAQSMGMHFENYVMNLYSVMEHYELHNENYADGFLVFYSKHYGALKEKHQEQHEREQNENTPVEPDCSSSHFTDLIVKMNKSFFLRNYYIPYSKANYYYVNLISKFEKQKIFQPPQ